MKVEILQVGNLETNCYLAVNEENNEVIVIDPGAEGEAIAQVIKEENYTCKAIMFTHGHYDHVDGTKDLLSALDEPVKVYALDKEKDNIEPLTPDVFFKDGDVTTLAGLDFMVIATPGHTPGGCCYYFKNEGILFSGDTLFAEGIGRTDFPGGNYEDIESSIRNKLYTLPDETHVLPGHMGPTTIGHEKTSNMFIRC